MNTNHDELRELTEAYVLGGLSGDERRAFEAHLTSCEDCSTDVRELMRVTEALACLVPQLEPPPQLRNRVLDAALRAAAAPAAETVRSSRSVPAWMAAAAALAALAIGLYAASLYADSARMEAELERARLRIASAERELAQLREAAGAAERARMVLVAADVSQVELHGQTAAPRAHGRALWSDSAGLLFTAADLPALPAGRVYQLWVVTKSQPLSAGLVTPDAAGRASLVTDMPPGTQPVQIALTIEPAGGVPAPTGAVLLAGAI